MEVAVVISIFLLAVGLAIQWYKIIQYKRLSSSIEKKFNETIPLINSNFKILNEIVSKLKQDMVTLQKHLKNGRK